MDKIGLIDKKGNEIYIGDIVEIIHPCWSAICIVTQKDKNIYFVEQNNPIGNAWVRLDKLITQLNLKNWKIEKKNG
jgi:hypothetical protein